MNFLEWLTYKSAKFCIALAPGIIEGIERRGIQKNNIKFISNGCDLSTFRPNASPWRPQVVSKKDFLAVFSGAHGPANGLDSIIDVASELKKRGRNDIKLVLIGDGKLKPELMRSAAIKKLDNIVFEHPVSKKQLAGLMANADVGLQVLKNVPAFYQGTSPNKFFDYISAGLPVINNYPGWIAEIIKFNECGFVVKPDDCRAFADVIEEAANNRKKLIRLGKNARQLAIKEFDRGKLSDLFVDCLEEALN